MKALVLFTKYAPNRTFLAIVLGSLSGMFYAFLIPIVMKALSPDVTPGAQEDKIAVLFGFDVARPQFAIVFLGLVLLILLTKSLAGIILSRVSLEIRFRLRKQLYDKVKHTQIAALEQVGPSRLIQCLSTDVSAIVRGAQLLPAMLTNIVTLIGMLGYLAYLETEIFYYIVKVIIFGVITYQVPVLYGSRMVALAREHKDNLQEAFRGLIGGAKELKLSPMKQAAYERDELHKHERIIMSLEKRGMTAYELASNYGGLLTFFAIGGVCFVFLNYIVISPDELVAVVMVLLYVAGPITVLLNFIPALANTRISLNKIDHLYKAMPGENTVVDGPSFTNWQTLSLTDVTYSHKARPGSGKPFAIGPLTLQIKRGEVTFIAGGNGSGKTTLSKVISHHYLANEGQIDCDGKEVNRNSVTGFRNEIACIYSDYYLFEKILSVETLSEDYLARIEHYLEAFGIADKVAFKDGRFTTLKLSDGQRRRLALVVAIVEDKSLYVFDEWAADQDPEFKRVFYREILPYLKNQNKAVVVISHDDRYFDVADQLLVMEAGKLETIRDPSKATTKVKAHTSGLI